MYSKREMWLSSSEERYPQTSMRLNEGMSSFMSYQCDEPGGSRSSGLKRSSGYSPLSDDPYKKTMRLDDIEPYGKFSFYGDKGPSHFSQASFRDNYKESVGYCNRRYDFSHLDNYRGGWGRGNFDQPRNFIRYENYEGPTGDDFGRSKFYSGSEVSNRPHNIPYRSFDVPVTQARSEYYKGYGRDETRIDSRGRDNRPGPNTLYGRGDRFAIDESLDRYDWPGHDESFGEADFNRPSGTSGSDMHKSSDHDDHNRFKGCSESDNPINVTSNCQYRNLEPDFPLADNCQPTMHMQTATPLQDTLTLQKIRGVCGPCGKNMLIILKSTIKPLKTLLLTKKIMKLDFLCATHYDPDIKKWVGQMLIKCKEFASGRDSDKIVAKEAAAEMGLQKLREIYYTLYIKYNCDGKMVNPDGKIVPMNLNPVSQQFSDPSLPKYYFNVVTDIPKLKRVINDYIKSDNVNDLLFSPEISKKALKTLEQYAKRRDLVVEKSGKPTGKYLLMSKKLTHSKRHLSSVHSWSVIEGLINNDVRYINKYQLLKPGEKAPSDCFGYQDIFCVL